MPSSLANHEKYDRKRFDPNDVVPCYGYASNTTSATRCRRTPRRERASPTQQDKVFRAICTILADLSEQDVNVGSHDYWVYPLDRSSTLWNMRRNIGYTKHYVFKARGVICGNHRSWSVPVRFRFVPGQVVITGDNIQVCLKHTWISFTAWLLAHERDEQIKGDMGIKAQQFWWAKLGKHFPLESLPSELRKNIFQQTLGGNMYPEYKPVLRKIVFNTSSSRVEDQQTAPNSAPDRPNCVILRASKQTQQEALEAAWNGTIKHFKKLPLMETVLRNRQLGPRYNWLTSIQLNFELMDYFVLFGVNINPTLRFRSNGVSARSFKALSSLKAVELYFPTPMEGHNNPWKQYKKDKL